MSRQERLHPPADEETLARAALTHATDGADALMHATLLGAKSACTVFKLLAEFKPERAFHSSGQAYQALDYVFLGHQTLGGSSGCPGHARLSPKPRTMA